MRKAGHDDSKALEIAELVKVICDVDKLGDQRGFVVDLGDEENDEKREVIEVKTGLIVGILNVLFVFAGLFKVLELDL